MIFIDFIDVLTYLCMYLPTAAYQRTYLPFITYLPTHQPTSLPTYLPISHSPIDLPTHLQYLLNTCLPTYKLFL
jgi:hypothetical protein